MSCNVCSGSAIEHLLTKNGFDLAACATCGLIFVTNPPDDSERARLYSFEAGYHEGLSRDPPAVALHQHEAMANLAVLQRHRRSGRLLDIGCSTGLFLMQANAAGWQGEGLEYSEDSARIATARNGLKVRSGELRKDTYASGSFDVVTMWDVIEHVPDPKATLAMVSDVVAPGGLLVLKTPNADGLYPRASLKVADRLGFWGHAEPPGHLYQFSDKTLRRLVDDAGFEVLAVHHQRIPIAYSFGNVAGWFRSLKWMLYCAMFIPVALLGPLLRRGDDMVLVARQKMMHETSRP